MFLKMCFFATAALVVRHTVCAADDASLKQRAVRCAQRFLIVDTHIDVPYRLQEKFEDISLRTEGGNFDYVRAKAGGLNAPFMSIYTPASLEEQGGSKTRAEELIRTVDSIATANPKKFAVAYSVRDVRKFFKRSVIALPMGMENGSPIEGKLENLQYFFDKGIRYITLAHGKRNHLSDSSYDPDEKWNGLSPFGEEVVREMNRLGIMIDVSHLSDSAFYDVMRLSQAPVIASHSSCRHFTPGFQRNMSDEMIMLLASKGGVVCINFGSDFISDVYRRRDEIRRDSITQYLNEHNIDKESADGKAWRERYEREHSIPVADVKDVAAHIDYIVQLVGVDHVGFGSDFDGVGESLPTGLKDVSEYPNLIFELLNMGYTERDVKKICGENVLRVWSNVERFAKKLQRLSTRQR